jgi:PAS domain S-box-containing protein
MPADDLAIRILIIDDDEDDFFITSEYIKNIRSNNFEIEWCFKYSDALENISNKNFDLYLIDYHLGAKTGLDLIKEAIKNNWEQPFILLTGKGNQQIDIEAMQAGAVDYLIKSELDTEKLERCIRYSMERAKSVRALKANEKKFRNIFERYADAVFMANKDLVFIDTNEAASRLLDYSKSELVSMNLFSFITDPDEVKSNLMAELIKNREVDGKEITIKSRSGVLKNCMLAVSEEQNAEGNYYQGIIHDITNLKKAEKATLRMEKRGVADRLVHVLAHEVRNPLNNINLSLEQLSPDLQDTESQIYVDIISRNSKRIEHLITELLGSSRPAQIVQKMEPLKEIIDDSITAAKDRITLKKIELDLSFPEEEIMILADAEKLKIALLNIIINAVEATDQNQGKLEIILDSLDNEPRLTIRDNGCGISEENLSRLFEPYFTAKRNGMGLGLATTLNILQSHKAEVEVQSKLNEGTAFIIIFKP